MHLLAAQPEKTNANSVVNFRVTPHAPWAQVEAYHSLFNQIVFINLTSYQYWTYE